MNIWSFAALLAVDMAKHWIFRLLWIPVLGLGTIYWFRKKKMGEMDLILAIISQYLLFMISYGWISEQSFLDPLPFIFLLIIAYRPRKLHVYILTLIQILVYCFSIFNWGPFIFEPLIKKFFPSLLEIITSFDPSQSAFIWQMRGTLGLIISILLGLFLLILLKPEIADIIQKKIKIRKLS